MKKINEDYGPLLKKMPLFMRLKVKLLLHFRGKSPKDRMAIMKKVNQRRHFKVTRSEIPWHPAVDLDRCIGCGVCISFCPKKVYEKDEKNKPLVVNPHACVFLCKGCIPKCKVGAISFPDKKDFYDYFYYR